MLTSRMVTFKMVATTYRNMLGQNDTYIKEDFHLLAYSSLIDEYNKTKRKIKNREL